MNRQDGFTLIEAMVAVVILAIGMVGLIGLHMTAARSDLLANDLTQAKALAMTQLESVRNGLRAGTPLPGEATTVGDFRVVWGQTADVPVDPLIEVTVAVGWPSTVISCDGADAADLLSDNSTSCDRRQEYTTYVQP